MTRLICNSFTPTFDPTGPFLPMDMPVEAGLVALHLFGGSLAKSLFNFVDRGQQGCAVVGSPDIATGRARFRSRANANPAYLTTPYYQTENMFVTAAVRFVGTTSVGSANQAVVLSNQRPNAADGYLLTSGFSLQASEVAGALSIYGSTDRCTAADATPTPAESAQAGGHMTPAAFTTWYLVSMLVPSVGRSVIRNLTTGIEVLSNAAYAGAHQIGTQALRIGSSLTSSQGGEVDIACLSIHNRALSELEQTAHVAKMRTLAALQGITV